MWHKGKVALEFSTTKSIRKIEYRFELFCVGHGASETKSRPIKELE